MEQSKIMRINELAKKAKNQGLSEEEKQEQASLRAEYIAAMRGNLQAQLNNMSVQTPDGEVRQIKKK